MDHTLLSAIPVVLGSIVGASTTIATAWITQRTHARRQLLSRLLRSRETLYGEFISECARLAIDSLGHGMEKPETLWTAYALLNRIRLSASPAVLAEAQKVVSRIITQYASPNVTAEEFQTLASTPESDPLNGFGEACRRELKSLAGDG